MKTDDKVARKSGSWRNWLTLAGGVVAVGSFFAFLLLFAIDMLAAYSNPYMGILAYVIAPGFLFLGLTLVVAGIWWQRWRARKLGVVVSSFLAVDLSRSQDRKKLWIFGGASVVFLLATAIGSYQTYHVAESVQFCGQACHGPMKPEYVAYQVSPHARVSCVQCHVGGGAEAFVRAKMNGVHQLIAVFTDDYHRPIKTPIRNLRPARETCEQCHWPQKFSGNIDRTYQSYLADETNTPYAVRLSLLVGGADPEYGPVGGIHWHVSQENKIEYIATDERRQVIPWVRVTDPQGNITEYRTPRFTNDVRGFEIRTMDCMDCHNRPAHQYASPNDAVNFAMRIGKISPSIPWVKSNVVELLAEEYATETEALEKLKAGLREIYADRPEVDQLVTEVQNIYRKNFFPEMKVSWEAYPVNAGHKDWPGCFRCHDDRHHATTSERTIPASGCQSCHTILAQGQGAELDLITPQGQEFRHPGDPIDGACNDCHTGGP